MIYSIREYFETVSNYITCIYPKKMLTIQEANKGGVIDSVILLWRNEEEGGREES